MRLVEHLLSFFAIGVRVYSSHDIKESFCHLLRKVIKEVIMLCSDLAANC